MNIGTMPMTNTIRWACQNPLWRTAAILLMLLAVSSSDALAQRPTPKKEKEGSRAILDGTLNIKDGLKMRYRYYPGPKDESTVPVILVHGLDGRGGDFDRLARFLSSDSGGGHSVFVPDLRGHGSSTVIEPPNGGKSINIRSERLRKNDFAAMVRMDMEAAKRFLLKEHAKRALNIEGLTIIGADVGALVAVHWAARDWSWPALAGVKQGQDVQAMVLLSPAQTFKGITAKEAMAQKDMQSYVSVLIIYGEESSKVSSSIRRINATLKKNRKMKWTSAEERRAEQDLFVFGLPTSLQGTDLLTDQQLPTAIRIKEFIAARVSARMQEEFPWKERANPLE